MVMLTRLACRTFTCCIAFVDIFYAGQSGGYIYIYTVYNGHSCGKDSTPSKEIQPQKNDT